MNVVYFALLALGVIASAALPQQANAQRVSAQQSDGHARSQQQDQKTAASEQHVEEGFELLFPTDGIPTGWTVRHWDDVGNPADEGVHWEVREGVLHGSEPRGTWLISEREYADFELRFDFKLGERGNSGLALRAPLDGDPAFDGLELQMADLRYNAEAKDSELTGGIYRAIAPTEQVYKPEEWNSYEVTLHGNHLRVILNGQTIHDLNLDEQDQEVLRHDGSQAPAVKDRPRRGHIGFQELSRNGDHALIRNARIKVLDDPAGNDPVRAGQGN